jgi:hypothetical protein
MIKNILYHWGTTKKLNEKERKQQNNKQSEEKYVHVGEKERKEKPFEPFSRE